MNGWVWGSNHQRITRQAWKLYWGTPQGPVSSESSTSVTPPLAFSVANSKLQPRCPVSCFFLLLNARPYTHTTSLTLSITVKVQGTWGSHMPNATFVSCVGWHCHVFLARILGLGTRQLNLYSRHHGLCNSIRPCLSGIGRVHQRNQGVVWRWPRRLGVCIGCQQGSHR